MNLWDRFLCILGCILLTILGAMIEPILIQLLLSLLNESCDTGCGFICHLITGSTGRACEACEYFFCMAAKALGSFVLGLFILGIAVAIARCWYKCIFRPREREEEEEEEESCEITLAPDMITYFEFLPCDGSHDPMVLAMAPADGSNYNWTIIQGSSRVTMNPIPGSSHQMNFRLTSASIAPNDVTIKVQYTDDEGQTRQCTKSFSVLTPRGLDMLEERPISHSTGGIWYLGVERYYQVLDQFDQPLLISELRITETLSGIDINGLHVSWSSGVRQLSFNPGNIALVGPGAPGYWMDAQTTLTNPDGRFHDTVHIYRDRPFELDTDFMVFQEIQAQGCIVRENTIHFLHDSIDIEP